MRQPVSPERDTATPKDLTAWLALLEQRHPTSIDLDLGRCGAVYEALGSPRPARHVITVAGTNGKGSTVAWACAALEAFGFRHAAYTSPHLLRFNERLQINHVMVSSARLVKAFQRVEAARGKISLTYFEYTTLACLQIMSEENIDVAVLEVGLGGRLDTVNLVDADVSVITPIGLDHQAFLGDDRQTIGREKAGILRREKPCVMSERYPPNSVLERAAELECPMLRRGRDFDIVASADQIEFSLGAEHLALPKPPLLGDHQLDNLAAALAAVFQLHPPDEQSQEQLGACLPGVRLAGRLQQVDPEARLLIDVGHNPLAAEAIRAFLGEKSSTYRVAVLGMLKDKDVESVVRILSPCVDHWLCVGLEGWRGQPGHVLAQRVSEIVPADTVEALPSVHSGMTRADRLAGASGHMLVFGSFHTASEASDWLLEQGRLDEG